MTARDPTSEFEQDGGDEGEGFDAQKLKEFLGFAWRTRLRRPKLVSVRSSSRTRCPSACISAVNASAAAAGPAQGSLDTSDLRTREGPLEPHSAAVGPAKTLGGDSRLDARTASIDLKRTLLWSVLIVGVAALGTMAWKLARSL